MRALWILLTACSVDTAIESTATVALTTADVWPQAGGNPAHTGASADSIDPASLHLVWSATTGLQPGTPVVATARAYIGSENNTLYAFDGNTGRRAWRAFAGDDIWGTPAAAYGKLYFVSDDGFLYAVSSTTGALAWRADVRPYQTYALDSRRVSPTVHGNRVYTIAGTRLSVFDATTGARAWFADVAFVIGSGWQAGVAIGKGNAFVVGGTPGNSASIDLHAFALAGCAVPPCAPVWTTSLPLEFAGYQLPYPLVYNGGRVYLATNNAIYATYADTGVRRWHRNLPCTGAPAIAGGVVYQPTATGLVALEEANVGKVIWRSNPAWGPAWPPAVATDIVIGGLGDRGRLAAFAVGCASDGGTCEPQWTDDVEGTRSQPAIAGAMVFAGNYLTNELRVLGN